MGDPVGHDSIFSENITETFLQDTEIVINESYTILAQYDWIAYLLFGLLAGISIIWYLLPERLANITIFPSDFKTVKLRDRAFTSPGFLISAYLFINYLVSFTLFIFLSIKYFTPNSLIHLSDNLLIFYISIVVFIFFFFRIFYIRTAGFLFQSTPISKQQQALYFNIDSLLGIILIPVLVLMMYTNIEIFTIIGIIIILIIYIFRWFQSFFLGNSILGFSLLHLFMYLCTLEIIPLLILTKMLKSSLIF